MFSGIGGFELGIERAYENIRANRQQEPNVEGVQPERDKSNSKGSVGNQWQQNTCVGYSEIDKYAIQIYEKHFKHKNYGDATKINASELPDFDLLVGGFPCQAFSIAGKRGGFNDTRGTLFFDIVRIAKAKQPMFMLLENVKGLISHDGGKTLEVILETLQELGYYTNYEIRNSKDYGVPQNRERIFFLCKHIKLLSSVGQSEKMTSSEQIIQEWLFQLLLNNLTEVKKLQGHVSKDWVVGYLLLKEIKQNLDQTGGNILGGISTPTAEDISQSKAEEVWQSIDMCLKNLWVFNSNDISKYTTSTAIKQIIESKTYTFSTMLQAISLATVLLRQSSSHLWNEILSSLILIQEDTKYARLNNKNEKTVISESGTAHISAELQDSTEHFALGHLGGCCGRQVFPIYGNESEDHSPTLRATYHKGYQTRGPMIGKTVRSGGRGSPHGSKQNWDSYEFEGLIRRLTPTECERLQGYPDGWTGGASDTQRYKTLGNSVTVNVIQAIMEKLL